jgi:hypothetical protein
MKTTVSSSDFHDAFRAYDRMENFSYEGRNLIFDYLESIEEDTGEEMELDVIAICCDFNEDNPLDIAKNYDIDLSDCDIEDADEVKDAVLEYLNENTSVVGETDSGNIVYQAF